MESISMESTSLESISLESTSLESTSKSFAFIGDAARRIHIPQEISV